MTLVAAFRCRDNAILLCADREYDDGIAKRPIEKIFMDTGLPQAQLFMAGAGPSNAVTDTWTEIVQAMHKAVHYDKRDILLEHRAIIESSLRVIHQKHKEDLKPFPMGLLIVVAPRILGSMPILYRTDRSNTIVEAFYAAYGTGKTIADYFADRLYKHGLQTISLITLAAFILREAEKSASGVGLGNDMVIIFPGGSARQEFHSESIEQIQAGIPPLKDAIYSHWAVHAKVPDWLTRDYAAADESK